MTWYDKEYEPVRNEAEKYRQDYEDALDEIRNLKFKIAELEKQIRKQEEIENAVEEFDRQWYQNFYQSECDD